MPTTANASPLPSALNGLGLRVHTLQATHRGPYDPQFDAFGNKRQAMTLSITDTTFLFVGECQRGVHVFTENCENCPQAGCPYSHEPGLAFDTSARDYRAYNTSEEALLQSLVKEAKRKGLLMHYVLEGEEIVGIQFSKS